MQMSPDQMISIPEAEDFAQQLADASRAICLKHFRGALNVEDKADASPVTQADKECEAAIRAMIKDRFPDHGIVGEEQDNEASDSPFTWVIDPIDGTRAFATGFPAYGSLIALLADGSPICGVCDMPSLGERFVGGKGDTTRFNGKRCQTSGVTDLSKATLRFTSHEIFDKIEFQAFTKVSKAARFAHAGGDCYNYGLLAAGHCDLVVEASLQAYDVMALLPIVEGAGGLMTDWNGDPVTLDFNGRILAAATPELHEQALIYLQDI